MSSTASTGASHTTTEEQRIRPECNGHEKQTVEKGDGQGQKRLIAFKMQLTNTSCDNTDPGTALMACTASETSNLCTNVENLPEILQ